MMMTFSNEHLTRFSIGLHMLDNFDLDALNIGATLRVVHLSLNAHHLSRGIGVFVKFTTDGVEALLAWMTTAALFVMDGRSLDFGNFLLLLVDQLSNCQLLLEPQTFRLVLVVALQLSLYRVLDLGLYVWLVALTVGSG